MKKKLIIFGAVIGVLFLIGFTSAKSNQPVEPVDYQWEFMERPVETITIAGVQQNLEVEIIDSGEVITTVEMNGKVTKDEQKKLAAATIDGDNLTLDLNKMGLQIMMNDDLNSVLKVKITTNLAKPFKNLVIDSSMGDVTVSVPEKYQGTFETKNIQNQGEVVSLPTTTKAQSSTISVATRGDILIKN